MRNKNFFLLLVIFIVTAGLFFIAWQGFGQGHILSYKNIEKGLDLSGGVYIVYEAQEEATNASEKTKTETETKAEEKTEEKSETETKSENVTENKAETQSILENDEKNTETKTDGEAEIASDLNDDTKKDEKALESTWEAKMQSAIAMIQSRLDRKGWTEANVYKEGAKRIRVEIPGVEDAETAVKEIGQTAKLSFADLEGNELVKGEDVINATRSAYTDQMGVQKIVVSLEFNKNGKEAFKKATENNIGKQLLIVLDDSIISAPTVNTAITDGNAIIEGGFDMDSAEELASLIRAGSLPFELEILEMNTVGATLGANALTSSVFGGAVGLLLVLIFMLLFYRANGFAANLALIIYILLELILLNGLNITLTLHGIAGIILSIGMAVDANVIIFERIREELKAGRTIKLSIVKGFSRAFPAILDSNITTLIAAGVLYWLGTGPIKGFAQTLFIGITLSMFTSLVITRVILNTMVGAGIKNPKLYGGR